MVDQAEIHRMSLSEDVKEQRAAAEQLGKNFAELPDKKQAWEDLIRLTSYDDSDVRWRTVYALDIAFSHVPDKKQAWNDLHRLTSDNDSNVRWGTANALGIAFSHVPDKKQAWYDLHRLTSDKDSNVRWGAANALGIAFSHVPDKKQAWSDLHRLTSDNDNFVRWGAADALSIAFSYVPDKEQAWNDLHRLTSDVDNDVRWRAANALGIAFSHVPDKEQAWDDIIRLTSDNSGHVRWRAANALGIAFSHVPDKKLAWDDLHSLTSDNDSGVRSGAANALGIAFSHVPDKKLVWDDLHRLASDKDRYVRIAANHSSGKVSIFRASEADEDGFKLEMENAIGFFEKASNEATYYDNPAKFCLPFYRSFYALTFKKEEADTDVQIFLSEAKSAVEGSESKEKLFEAVENLENALKEAQKARDFGDVKSDLNAYRRYCERVFELLDTTEEKAPGASKVIRKGLPIIDERIKRIIAEIQEKTKVLCKNTKGTQHENLGKEVANVGENLLKIRDSIGLEKALMNLEISISAMCKILPDEEKREVCELLTKAKEENSIADRVELIHISLINISKFLESPSIFHKSAEDYKNKAKAQTGEKKRLLIIQASQMYSKASELYEKQGMWVDSYITRVLSKSILISIEDNDLRAIKLLDEIIDNIDKAIKITDEMDVNQLRRLQGMRYEYLGKKNIRLAIIHNENFLTQDKRLSDIVDCFVNASKMFEKLEGENKEYGSKCKGCACLYESLKYLSNGIKTKKIFYFYKSFKTFKKSKKYYTSANSNIGIDILDKINDMTKLLKKFIDQQSESVKNGNTIRIMELDEMFEKIDAILEEISAVTVKKILTNCIFETAMASIENISGMNKEPKKEIAMTTIKINNSKSVQVGMGNDINQVQDSGTPKRKAPKKQKTSKKQINPKEPAKANENPKPPIPYLSELESEIADIFKSIYQKDRKAGVSEVNAKTLESLKHKLHDLKASGNNINWLDMGCGDGRCLEVLDDIQDRGNIYYHGIDISHKFLDDAQIRARKYGIKSNIETMNTAAMEFDSEFDLVSAVLFLHEVDPLCLPYVIRNMLRALKSDGTLVISDFEGPYEQEEGVVSWGAEYLEKFLSNIGGARMSPGFVPSGEFPKELGFYRCYVKKPELDEERFKKFIEGYGGFMKAKKEDSRKRREELRSQINKRVCEILKRPDIDTKNITDEDKKLLRESMGKEYGIKAMKIRLLTNEILFLDEKIGEFERGERCGSI